MQAVIPFTDCVLFDYKVTGTDALRHLTGADEKRILANLDIYAQSGIPLYLRCPMIPGINDSSEHLRSIAHLSQRYPYIQQVEIMPYHRTGNAKHNRYGHENALSNNAEPDEQCKQLWLDQLLAYGCEHVVIG